MSEFPPNPPTKYGGPISPTRTEPSFNREPRPDDVLKGKVTIHEHGPDMAADVGEDGLCVHCRIPNPLIEKPLATPPSDQLYVRVDDPVTAFVPATPEDIRRAGYIKVIVHRIPDEELRNII